MPDGAATGQGSAGEEGPLSPTEQIDEAASQDWLDRLVGDTSGADVGGGGQNGKFMFADIPELDSVLGLWRQERAAIELDRLDIDKALTSVKDMAGDPMSRMSGETSRASLEAMKAHADEMLNYTNDYIERLEESRELMQNQEASSAQQVRNVY